MISAKRPADVHQGGTKKSVNIWMDQTAKIKKRGDDMAIDVSVILLTYNCDYEKTITTLNSIINQENVALELIVADDGSTDSHQKKIEGYVRNRQVANFHFVANPINQGTVKNCLSGLAVASGKYVYFISPGDLIFDRDTLSEFHKFALDQDANICFGNTQCFQEQAGSFKLVNERLPRFPRIYNWKFSNYLIGRIGLVYGQRVFGPAYLRKRSVITEYLEKIEGKIIYMEDTPTSLLYLLDGNHLTYFDRYVVWYEHGTGITTSNGGVMNPRIAKDNQALELLLKKDYGRNRIVHSKYFCNRLKMALIHPFIFLTVTCLKVLSLSGAKPLDFDKGKLEDYQNALKV